MSTQASSTACDDQFTSPPPESIVVTDNTVPPQTPVLPCPFCGIEVSIGHGGGISHPLTNCAVAAVAGMFQITPADFIKLWNTRAPK